MRTAVYVDNSKTPGACAKALFIATPSATELTTALYLPIRLLEGIVIAAIYVHSLMTTPKPGGACAEALFGPRP